MPEKQENTPNELMPGRVPYRQFELLLAGTSISSQATIAALRDHLVVGAMPMQACSAHGVSASLFSRRLKVLRRENARAAALCPFYTPPKWR